MLYFISYKFEYGMETTSEFENGTYELDFEIETKEDVLKLQDYLISLCSPNSEKNSIVLLSFIKLTK